VKNSLLLISISLLLAIITIPIFGCITVVSPQPSESPSNAPVDTVPQQTENAPETTQIVINSFTADPSAIESGASAIISWDVSGATSVNIDGGIGSVDSAGHIAVTPPATTIYTLTASNGTDTKTASVQVIVSSVTTSPKSSTSTSGLPVIHSFTSEPEIITAGESSTISWSVYNATSVTINPAVYRQLTPIPATGSAPVSPSVTTTYTLTAANAAGARTETVTVTVISATVVSKDWSGTWDTNWGTMHLTQSQGKVTGTYSWDDGKIEGYISKNLSGDMLAGTWSEEPSYAPPSDAGDFEFIMAPDFNSFTGCWRYGSSGEWEDCDWTGTRVTP